jgi:hypothetical protein
MPHLLFPLVTFTRTLTLRALMATLGLVVVFAFIALGLGLGIALTNALGRGADMPTLAIFFMNLGGLLGFLLIRRTYTLLTH